MDPSAEPLPDSVSSLFVEYGPGQVSWERDRDFVVERILANGSWEAIQWARARGADARIRDLLLRKRGRRLSPAQLRLWQVILDLPEETVGEWIRAPGREIWDRRRP
ncbi:MAG TPA: hypothetical protein VFI25_00680 [Planctomycetota bacterium]|jgi:hypothetical protein|nr:hypothetical protein [Planctomycetota bacterium]